MPKVANRWDRRVRSHSISEMPNMDSVTLDDTHLEDAGLKPHSFYSSRMNPLSARIREHLLPLLEWELPILTCIQNWHSPILTFYFLHTANLGSHTFYVLMLPIPAWFGYLYFIRDLVFILGLGIYFTGFVKDELCLPRPSSPPLKRLTLSTYTAREYGCPSSHTANATGVCLIIVYHLINNSPEFSGLSSNVKIISIIGIGWYWLSLVGGRIYCGMHGLVDISIGALIGAFVVILRLITCHFHDNLILYSHSPWAPLFIILGYYFLIYIHPVPVDACPCYEDTVAFIGVLMGLDLGHFFISNSSWINEDPQPPALIGYSYSTLGFIGSILRVAVGVLIVVIWKALSKPMLTFVWPLPDNTDECYAFKPRNGREIWIKLIVYAGIAFSVAVLTKIVFPLIGLGVDP